MISISKGFLKSFISYALKLKHGDIKNKADKLQAMYDGIKEFIEACNILYNKHNQKFLHFIYIDIETSYAFIMVEKGFPENFFACLTSSAVPIYDKSVIFRQINPQVILGIVEE